MRKSIRSKSKRKWIVGGFAFFGGIALLTTGFAAWVFGVNQNTSGSGVNMGTDTAINDTVFLEIKTGEDNKLVLAESVAHPEKGQGEIASTAENKDGLITFDENGLKIDIDYTVVWGKDKPTPTTINFSLPKTGDDTLPQGVDLSKYVNDKVVTVEENVKYDTANRKGKTYFEAPESIDISAAANKAEQDNPTAESYTITASTKIEFKWGSFFNNVSPLNYYNSVSKSLYEKIGTDQYEVKDYLNDAQLISQQATEELNLMHGLFDAKEVYLLATLIQAEA